jgi:hypothetical protein
MRAASKKEIRSAMRQSSHRATRFRLHPKQTRWPRIPSDGVPSKAHGSESLDCSWRRCSCWLLLRCGPTGQSCSRLPCGRGRITVVRVLLYAQQAMRARLRFEISPAKLVGITSNFGCCLAKFGWIGYGSLWPIRFPTKEASLPLMRPSTVTSARKFAELAF